MSDTLYSAKSWAAAAFQLTDLLIAKLQETGVLIPKDAEKIRTDAIRGLSAHPDADFRRAAELLRAVYSLP